MQISFQLRQATVGDAESLAAMNRQLIEDEGSRNPMSLEQLTERMRGWLAKDWQAVLVTIEGDPAGYALYQVRRDEYFPEQPKVYVRQFFIARERRGQGTGAASFESIAREFFPPEASLELDVLSSNPGAMAFWERQGFAPYAVTMKR